MINIIFTILQVIGICGLIALTVRLNRSLDKRHQNAALIIFLGLSLLLVGALALFMELFHDLKWWKQTRPSY